MFAVIKTGGKQYKVAKDDILSVEKLAAQAGERVQFNDVLMLGGTETTIGSPLVSGAGVQAEVLEQGKGPKVLNFKRRRRKHSSRRLKGHRQQITTVKITDILAAGAEDSGIKAAIGAAQAGPQPATQAAPKADTAKTDAPKSDAPESDGGTHTRPANLLDAARGTPDDLTKISGVGPVLQEKLHQNGVFHFWQIAEWSADEVAFMDDQLSFKGRIERDNWIDQAKTFAAETEKE